MTCLDIWWKTPRFRVLNYLFKISLFGKLYQTLVTVFHQNIKNLEVRQKSSTTRHIFNSLLGVWYVMKHCVSCLINYFKNCYLSKKKIYPPPPPRYMFWRESIVVLLHTVYLSSYHLLQMLLEQLDFASCLIFCNTLLHPIPKNEYRITLKLIKF